jgi:hypothetical protein
MRSTASDHRSTSLPATLAPRGLNREQAAEYVGVGVTLFDRLVADGKLPKPVEVNSRRIWDRWALDASFGALAEMTAAGDGANYWDKVKQDGPLPEVRLFRGRGPPVGLLRMCQGHWPNILSGLRLRDGRERLRFLISGRLIMVAGQPRSGQRPGRGKEGSVQRG